MEKMFRFSAGKIIQDKIILFNDFALNHYNYMGSKFVLTTLFQMILL